jgi:hypothetical protein
MPGHHLCISIQPAQQFFLYSSSGNNCFLKPKGEKGYIFRQPKQEMHVDKREIFCFDTGTSLDAYFKDCP